VSHVRVYNPPTRRADRQTLLGIVAASMSTEALTRSDGRVVHNYVQGHLILGDPAGLRLASSLMLDAICETDADVVTGEVSAACALVSGIVTLSSKTGRPLTGRYVRRETRPYGIPGRLNAPLPAGSKIFLVDDVAATGASGERCVEAVQSLGHRAVAMMVVVDRDQGAAQRLARLGVQLWALFTLDEVRNRGANSWQTAASG
jgi:orotate phosphoribosyltransferase